MKNFPRISFTTFCPPGARLSVCPSGSFIGNCTISRACAFPSKARPPAVVDGEVLRPLRRADRAERVEGLRFDLVEDALETLLLVRWRAARHGGRLSITPPPLHLPYAV